MSKSFPEWWKHGQKVRTASDGILTLNISEDAEYWLTNDAGKEVSVFSADILGPASTPEACRMTDITELTQRLATCAKEDTYPVLSPADCGALVEALYRHAQPAPMVPALAESLISAIEKEQDRLHEEDYLMDSKDCIDVIRDEVQRQIACRAAMLQELPKSAGVSNNCRSSEKVQGLQAGNFPVIPDRWIPVRERVPESNGVYFGWDGKRVLEVNFFFGGWSANQFIHGEITHWMPLPSAPQEVK